MNIIRDKHNNALIETGNTAFTYSVMENPRDLEEQRTKEEDFDWNKYGMWIFDNFIIHPFGLSNDLPNKMRSIIQSNDTVPGLLTKTKKLLWGQGPKLYTEIVEDRQIFKDWKDYKESEAKEIYRWLKSWDFETYLEQAAESFQYMQSVFSKSIRNKGSRIGDNFINRLEHVSHDYCRLATKVDDGASISLQKYIKPTNAIITDYEFNNPGDLLNAKIYPLYDKTDPFKHGRAVTYSKLSTFLQDIYTLPDLYGSLEWIKRSTAVPLILKALSNNGIGNVFHVESPQKYWDKKEETIKENCIKRNIPYDPKMLVNLEEDIFRTITKVLSGAKNDGKIWHTKKIYDTDGSDIIEMGWTIKPIERDIKSFIESQILISDKTDKKLAVAANIHSSLGNLSETGKSDSGSEQLYAYMIYLATANTLPEMIITKHLNEVISANFPGSNLKVGFYHQQPQRQQDVTSSQRLEQKIQ